MRRTIAVAAQPASNPFTSTTPARPGSARLSHHRQISMPATYRYQDSARPLHNICRRHDTRPVRTAHRRHNAARSLHTSPPRRAESLHPQTHYDHFPESVNDGPPPHGPFSIDLKRLRAEFLRKQAFAHPDKFPPAQKQKAEALSAQINEAYRTLQDPLRRAQYLLSLRGVDPAEDETAKVEDQELLVTVMEAQERIEEAEEETELDGLTRENDGRIESSVAELEAAFGRDDVEGARREAVRLRYWTTIRDGVQNWEKGKPVVIVHS